MITNNWPGNYLDSDLPIVLSIRCKLSFQRCAHWLSQSMCVVSTVCVNRWTSICLFLVLYRSRLVLGFESYRHAASIWNSQLTAEGTDHKFGGIGLNFGQVCSPRLSLSLNLRK